MWARRGLRLAAIVGLSAGSAAAHVGESGIDYRRYKDRYGLSCCGERDCRPAADFVEAVDGGRPVVRLLIDGVWITVPRAFVVGENASDGRAHFCGRLHVPDGDPARAKPEPTCIILPPRGA